MPRKPEVPCASCGRLIWRGTTSLPPGKATCQPCRRKAKGRGPDELQPAGKMWRPRRRDCNGCGTEFMPTHHSQTYCSKDCRPRSRSGTKISAAERGYGPAHTAKRRWYKRNVVDKGNGYCWRCGIWLDPNEPWDLGHDDHDRTIYRGPECRPCNRGTAAARGNKMRPADRKTYDLECRTCGAQFVSIFHRQRYCSKQCSPGRKPPKPKTSSVYFPTCWCGAQFAARSATIKNCPAHRDSRTVMRVRYRQSVGIPLEAPPYTRAG